MTPEPRSPPSTGDDLLDLVQDAMLPRASPPAPKAQLGVVHRAGVGAEPQRARPGSAHAWARPGAE